MANVDIYIPSQMPHMTGLRSDGNYIIRQVYTYLNLAVIACVIFVTTNVANYLYFVGNIWTN